MKFCLSLPPRLVVLLLLGVTMWRRTLGFLTQGGGRSMLGAPRRRLHLKPRAATSVTGTVYQAKSTDAPTVTLFTKEGCTLCDKVKDVLVDVRESLDHSLTQIDITDDEHATWFDRYKYDIPVLHLNGNYWIKHRLSREEAEDGFSALKEGRFQSPKGEPNASEMERS